MSNYNILMREAKKLKAQVVWDRDSVRLDIEVQAPAGKLWASCGESTLAHREERSDPQFIREAVESLLDLMSQGYSTPSLRGCGGGDCCECDTCQSADTEVHELPF